MSMYQQRTTPNEEKKINDEIPDYGFRDITYLFGEFGFFFLCCDGWGYIVTFTHILMYQMHMNSTPQPFSFIPPPRFLKLFEQI
jgi:hypothetical protein